MPLQKWQASVSAGLRRSLSHQLCGSLTLLAPLQVGQILMAVGFLSSRERKLAFPRDWNSQIGVQGALPAEQHAVVGCGNR
jgi:hypothetical protein